MTLSGIEPATCPYQMRHRVALWGLSLLGGNALTAAFMILFFITFHALTRPDLGGAVSLACCVSYAVIIHVALVVKACERDEHWLRSNKIRVEKSCAK